MDGENTGDQVTFENNVTPDSFTIDHDTSFDTAGSHTIQVKIFDNSNTRAEVLLAESNTITVTIESAPVVEPSIEVSVNPSSHTMDPETASEEVELTFTVNFTNLDPNEAVHIEDETESETLATHQLTAQELTAGSFTEVVEYLCKGDDPGAKTITVSGTGTNTQTVTNSTTFTVTVDEAKKKN